jgi:probable phosphoglycerate mutase
MLHDRVFALAISSPLERARATAERACLDVAVEISDDLLEWDYGIYEGVTTDAVRRDIPDWSVWTHPIIDGETLDEVGHRADSVIERVLRAGSTVLFACVSSPRGGWANRPRPAASSRSTRRRSPRSGSNARTA